MARRKAIPESMVEEEIAKLKQSPYVKLAWQYKSKKYAAQNARRQYMYQLRWLESKGKELAENGTTTETLRDTEEGQTTIQEFIERR